VKALRVHGFSRRLIWHTASRPTGGRTAPVPDFRSIDEIRRKVISELVDLEIVVARRRLTRRQRFSRRLRRRLRGVIRRH